ncbi:MAG: DUF805 domain-containing protein [Pseudomonas sp.]|uniref:DUF805 domain-containing protein n=1 Tax=Pseudomonas sp. TaxID=306 RepID=UPI0033980D26
MNWYLDVLKQYAVFNGRARRKEYWMFFLINLVISMVLAWVDSLIGMSLLSIIYGLALLVPSIAVGIRRLHDTNRSGWWMLIALVPFAGIVLLVFLAIDSTPGDNQYGPNPKGVTA